MNPPNNPMMNSGPMRPQAKPQGVGSLMSPEFQSRDRSGYEPLVQASPAQLMTKEFQNRDRSGYEPLMSESKSIYPSFNSQAQSRDQNNIAQLRSMLFNAPARAPVPQQPGPDGGEQAASANPMGDEIENYFRSMMGGQR
jgi:hypothetical protein